MDGFEKELLRRLPLAEAVWRLLGHVANDAVLSEVFEAHRGRHYQKDVSFALLVQLITDALLQYGGSGRASFEQAQREGRLKASLPAAYGKLKRVPREVSEALLAETTRRLEALFPELPSAEVPPSLQAYEVIVLDGKKIKRLAKRLKPLRGVGGSLLGGKALVALKVRRGLAIAMACSLDGEANDAPLVPALLPPVRARVSGAILWVADRQFCDLKIPWQMQEGADAFLIRYTRKMVFEPDAQRPESSGKDGQGRVVREEWGWLGSAEDPRRLYVRRVTLTRPGEDDDVILVTSLLDGTAIPAADLLALYLQRWQIERVFQQITEVFQLQHLIGSSPQAAVFQCGLCLLLYNLLQTLRAYVAHGPDSSPADLSTELLCRDLTRQMISWTDLGSAVEWLEYAAAPQPPEVVRLRLAALLRDLPRARWKKAPPKKRWRPPAPTPIPGGHSSAWKLLQAHAGRVAVTEGATEARC